MRASNFQIISVPDSENASHKSSPPQPAQTWFENVRTSPILSGVGLIAQIRARYLHLSTRSDSNASYKGFFTQQHIQAFTLGSQPYREHRRLPNIWLCGHLYSLIWINFRRPV
ncbi:hypothetical protein [Neisseria iguanae]|uniref:hypothetical protein n=1 Tax=Neisseria iguanae TaxID=90242 RepID=UPI0011B242F0|nr:hypothetical protein [Neisseria iguanae]